MYRLCRVQELLSFTVRRIAAFDLLRSSYFTVAAMRFAAFAKRPQIVPLPRKRRASSATGSACAAFHLPLLRLCMDTLFLPRNISASAR